MVTDELIYTNGQLEAAVIEKTLAYYEICQFAVNYESVVFYSEDPEVGSSHA